MSDIKQIQMIICVSEEEINKGKCHSKGIPVN